MDPRDNLKVTSQRLRGLPFLRADMAMCGTIPPPPSSRALSWVQGVGCQLWLVS